VRVSRTSFLDGELGSSVMGFRKFHHGMSIVERAVNLAQKGGDAQSVINWTLVGQLR